MIEPLLKDEALLADIASVDGDAASMHLWWLGQSGYLLQAGAFRLLFDPYLSDSLTKKYAETEKPHVRMSCRVIDPATLPTIDLLTSTHNHTDHLDAETLSPILNANPTTQIAISAANVVFARDRLKIGPERLASIKTGQSITIGPATLRTVPASHEKLETDEHGDHRCVGFVVTLGGFTIYHAGDGVIYKGLAEAIGVKPDLAILPINGKVGNMNGLDAAQLAKQIGAKLVIPCHYDLFEFNTADPNALFAPACEKLHQPYRVLKLGERLTLRKTKK